MMSLFDSIAYCPLDLPKLEIDEKRIAQLLEKFGTDHHEGLWRCLPLVGRVQSQNDFKDAAQFEEAWARRYNSDGTIYLNENVRLELSSLFHALDKLPMVVTHAQILSQLKYVGKHYDLKRRDKEYIDFFPDVHFDCQPAGYKILLNNTHLQSFFVCKNFESEKKYIELPEDSNTFIINEKKFPHGASLLDRPKYIVSIFGLIKKHEHQELILRSLKKYSKYSILFDENEVEHEKINS